MSTIISKHVLSGAVPRRYLVRRNARGALPVYTDVRNGGTRVLVLVRNVDGHANDLARDLRQSLFDPHSSHAKRLSVKVQHQRHVVLSGGPSKRDVSAWLTAKGF